MTISVYFSWREWWAIAAVLAACLVPLVTTSILSFRSYRRGWWLVLPGGLFAILAPLTIWLFFAVRSIRGDSPPVFLVSLATIFAAWIVIGLFLILLAWVGPRLPTLDVGEIF